MISLIIKDFNNYNEIISNNNLQGIYDNQMAKVDYLTFTCPKCGCKNWHIHAYYKRNITFYGYVHNLILCRVKCCRCNVTHVILPSFIIPYQHNSLFDILLEGKSLIKDLKDFIKSKSRFISLIFLYPT